MNKTKEQRRIARLELALRPFAELPLTDNAKNPVVDIHVNYRGGTGWSMKLASLIDARVALKRARAAMRAPLAQ